MLQVHARRAGASYARAIYNILYYIMVSLTASVSVPLIMLYLRGPTDLLRGSLDIPLLYCEPDDRC